MELFELNPEYSTTRLVTRDVPTIEDPPDAAFKTIFFLPEGEGRKGEGGLRTQNYFKCSLPDKPLITVITVVFNGVKYLEETILSVISQSYDNIEYIIIDGGSIDGTLDIIYKYEHAIDYWVSEKDEGIYYAMNKGIFLTTGQGILFLNAGDLLKGNVFSHIKIPCFLKVKYEFMGVLTTSRKKNNKMGLPVPHQGILFKKLYITYNTDYKISSDYDYFLKHKYDFHDCRNYKDAYVYYDNKGISWNNYKQRDNEIQKIIKDNFGLFYIFLFYIKSSVKSSVKSIIRIK